MTYPMVIGYCHVLSFQPPYLFNWSMYKPPRVIGMEMMNCVKHGCPLTKADLDNVTVETSIDK